MKYYVVETIATYHMKYLIAQPDDHLPEYCLDTVTCEEADDLVQNYLGEQILGFEEVDDERLVKHLENSWLDEWPVSQVKEVYAKVVQDE